ncbi:MAG: winged helix-turn-helix transcriptional regulator [Chthoniobacteraceae bacterium]
MKQRLIEAVAPNTRLKILNELKRTQGLHAGELAERLGMSYMGVKEMCDEMHKSGLLDTWRKAQARGRPFKLYRLTQRAHDLFPTASNALTRDVLDAAQKLFGPSAPEKLLLVVFQKATAGYAERLRDGTPAQRAKWLARLRDHDGCMSEFETGGDGALRIVEHHSPILDVLRAFPIVVKLEAEMFGRLLGVPVRREEDAVSGLFRAIFHIG